VGAHPHSWTTPPVREEEITGHAYLHTLPRERQREKLRALDDAIGERFGVKAVSHRGGRWSLDGTALRLLEASDGAAFRGQVDLFITPGYRFRMIDVLLTNFHLPRSTLFMLVGAFSGLERMRAAYEHAISQGYRFYSYGDACLLTRHDAF